MTVSVTRRGDQQAQPLVLLHGWGMHSGVWQALIPYLEKQFSLILIDLPGLGQSAQCLPEPYTMSAVCDQIQKSIPDQSVLLGWSLGGAVAMSLANSYPEKVSKVITLASTPCFVQREDWSQAMAEEIYQPFESSLADNAQKTLQRFNMLQTQGGASARSDLKQLKSLMTEVAPTDKGLIDSLALLRGDYRDVYSQASVPCLHLLCEADTVVPVNVADAIKTLQPAAHVRVLSDQSHVPLLGHPECVADQVLGWLQ